MNVSKSQGMLLGLADSVARREQAQAAVGVPFVAPGDHTRHLGVLLSAGDAVGAAKAMFAKRRAGVFLRVRSWARFNLSYLGRVHVAKQVLANTFCYHATFVAPPPEVLQQVVECIDSFVVLGRVLEAGEAPPLRHVPSAAVESLPWALGACGGRTFLPTPWPSMPRWLLRCCTLDSTLGRCSCAGRSSACCLAWVWWRWCLSCTRWPGWAGRPG